MTDRFDLEQDIFKSWHVIDDIDLLCERLVNEEELSKDEIVAFLISLKTIYNSRFNKLFNTFEQCISSFDKAQVIE